VSRRPAVFLDRDGTLTQPRHYPSRPADLVLQPDLGPPLRQIAEQGVALVLVTNQSGLARGFFTASDLERMHDHLRHLLRGIDVELDGIYVCPHHLDGQVMSLAMDCRCRKPRPGMLLQAARDLKLDLGRSWLVGDADSDVEAGQRASCRTVKVGPCISADPSRRPPTMRHRTTAEALCAIARARTRPTPRPAADGQERQFMGTAEVSPAAPT
jgi:D-glycero-D-manno-heptose 1,7-bisphosphate phosphatase